MDKVELRVSPKSKRFIISGLERRLKNVRQLNKFAYDE
jgi:hypothetical protein